MQIHAYFDGSCFPTNPGGYMGLGCVIYTDTDKYTYSRRLPKHPSNSNNIAEYQALLMLLEALLARNLQTKSILIKGDSQLIVNQVNGDWKVKTPHLKDLCEKCKSLLGYFNHVVIEWIPREFNTVADALSNPIISVNE